MTRLTALDIKKKEFQQKMRGADVEEVQAFLDEVSEEVEALNDERRELEERVTDLMAQLDSFVSLKGTMERTLVAAQQTAVRMEEQARKESELILREAAMERDRRMMDVQRDVAGAESNLSRLRAEYASTLARMNALLEGFGSFVKSMDSERKPGFTAVAKPVTAYAQEPAQEVVPEFSSDDDPTAPIEISPEIVNQSWPTHETVAAEAQVYSQSSPFTPPPSMPSPFAVQ